MLCAVCEQEIGRDVEPHDGPHDEGCPRLKFDWAACRCSLHSVHPWCCVLCVKGTAVCIPPPPLPKPRATGEPFAWAPAQPWWPEEVA